MTMSNESIPTYKWKELDLKTVTDESCMKNVKFWAARASAVSAIYSIASDAFLVSQLLTNPATKGLGTAYVIFAVLDILWSIRLYYYSKEVIERDVISETYIDPGAFRFMSLQSYNHFCFLSEIAERQTFGDKLIIGMYSGIREWFQLLVLDFPRLILAIIRLTSSTEATNASTAVAIYLKLLGLLWSIWTLMVIIFVYPCFKLCLGCEAVDVVASRRINQRIHDIAIEKKLESSSQAGPKGGEVAVEMPPKVQLEMASQGGSHHQPSIAQVAPMMLVVGPGLVQAQAPSTIRVNS